MNKLDMALFLSNLEKAKEFSLETDLEKLGVDGITIDVLKSFDRLMNAESTDELKDLSDDMIFEITKYSEKLTKLYKQHRLLSMSTFNSFKKMKGARKRRIL